MLDLQYFAGKNCFLWIGPKPLVIARDPEIIRDVFNKYAIYQKPKSTPLTKLLAQGVVSYEEDKWAKHRKILNPAFHMEKIKVFFIPLFPKSIGYFLAGAKLSVQGVLADPL